MSKSMPYSLTFVPWRSKVPPQSKVIQKNYLAAYPSEKGRFASPYPDPKYAK